jgi:hypothetical protein
MLLSSLLLALILFMRFGPDIPARRTMIEVLVKRPRIWFSKQERHDYLYLIILCGMLLAGGQVLLAMGLEFAMVYAADLALYLDIVAATSVITAVTRVKATVRLVVARLSTWRERAFRLFRTAPRERLSRKRPERADNDDEDVRGWPVQMAA